MITKKQIDNLSYGELLKVKKLVENRHNELDDEAIERQLKYAMSCANCSKQQIVSAKTILDMLPETFKQCLRKHKMLFQYISKTQDMIKRISESVNQPISEHDQIIVLRRFYKEAVTKHIQNSEILEKSLDGYYTSKESELFWKNKKEEIMREERNSN